MPYTETVEAELNVAPSRIWKATYDIHKIAPKVLPDVFESFTYIQGDGGAGSIREVKLRNPTTGETVTSREVLDVVDEKTHTVKFHVEDGDLKKRYISYSVNIALVPAGTDPNKTKVVQTIESEAVGDAGAAGEGEHKKLFFAFTKALEAHLLANVADYV